MKIVFKSNAAVIAAKKASPSLFEELERRVGSANTNYEYLHAISLREYNEAVEYVVDQLIRQMTEEMVFFDDFKLNVRNYRNVTLSQYYKTSENPQIIPFNANRHLDGVIRSIYHLCLLQSDYNDLNIKISDLISL